jgi:putative FmdB family regulatory protein
MPIYEFVCGRCKTRFDLRLSVADRDKATCPKCGSNDVRKCFGSINLGGDASLPSSCSGCQAETCAGCGSSDLDP